MEVLRRTSRTTLAIGTAILIFVALLAAYVLDLTNNDQGDADYVGWLIVSAIASIIAAAMLLRFVPATESEPDEENKPARRGLVIAVVALVTVVGFWTGLPFALGVPALVLAAEGRARAAQYGHANEATTATVIATFAIVVAFVLCIVG